MSAAVPEQLPANEEPPPDWLIWNVIRWMPLVERWAPDFPDLEYALVLAVIAQESQGFPYVIAEDSWGSTGLMQVGPRSWTGTREQLLDPAFNIFVGMRMLDATIEIAGSLRRGVAAYNCGFTSLDADRCHSFGGYAYADRVLDYWLPIFRTEMSKAGWVNYGQPTPTTTPERVAPPKATLTPTLIPTSTEAVAPPIVAFTEAPTPLPPTFTPIPNHPNKEVIDPRPEKAIIVSVMLAVIAVAFMTIRDWRKLGD